MTRDSGVKRFFLNNWEKIVLWAILIGLMFLLRPFFLLIFETFLFTYITRGAVKEVVRRLRLGHRLATVLVFVVFVSLLSLALGWVGPQLVMEATVISNAITGDREEPLHPRLTKRSHAGQPATIAKPAEPVAVTPSASEREPASADHDAPPPRGAEGTSGADVPAPAPVAPALAPAPGAEKTVVVVDEREARTQARVLQFVQTAVAKVTGETKANAIFDSDEYAPLRAAIRAEVTSAAKAAVPDVVQAIFNMARLAWQIVVSTLLALLFSFMLVMDWQRIAARVSLLSQSRVRTFYLGAAPHLVAFGEVLGKALRAQAIIATCNCVLTAIGLAWLGVPKVALLTAVVFICGFIPILGTFLSSIPILLIGLVDPHHGGLAMVAKLLLLILVVHAFEAYILNPRITGGVLRVHPLLVLVLLVMGERFFGVWGMVVGVPIGYYIISVLSKSEDSPEYLQSGKFPKVSPGAAGSAPPAAPAPGDG